MLIGDGKMYNFEHLAIRRCSVNGLSLLARAGRLGGSFVYTIRSSKLDTLLIRIIADIGVSIFLVVI